MAARKPSERRNYRHRDLNLDLTPMMNLIAILIPALLVSVAFIELTTLEARVPSDSSGSAEEPQLALRIEVHDDGYAVRYSEPGTETTVKAIGLVERRVECDRYTDTRPPPRSSNRERRACSADDDALPFLVYDTDALRNAIADLKVRHPQERSYVLSASEGIEYEALVEVMDGIRQWDVDGVSKAFFDQVTFGVPVAPEG